MGLNIVRNKIYKNCTQKVINGIGLNVQMMVEYLKQFVANFNSGRLPVIQTAWKSLIDTECRNQYEKSYQLYESGLKEVINNVPENEVYMKKNEAFKNLSALRDIPFNEYNKIFHLKDRDSDTFDKYKFKLKEYVDKRETSFMLLLKKNSKSKNTEEIQSLITKFMKETNPEKFNEEDLAEEIHLKVFQNYENNNYGGDDIGDFTNSTSILFKNMVDWYSNRIKMDSQSKKNSAVRNQSTENEKLKFENEQLKIQTNKVNELKKEVEKMETRITEFKSGVKNERISKLTEDKDKFIQQLQSVTELESHKSAEIGKLNQEVEKLTKKKKGC